ncbi:response regulator transcription factor [Metabacillus sp. GX 13764]|uniref:response regulator transcription factor n=1 Tax=Metabacillus kandeliae TaxID=2900151 RepID=UPI001E4CC448|nr:response regulator transcription factor [Metabacillus kandeliae]MCD7035731.1 response regulator transcription factor [Metabacillus kandeliae]
MIHILVVDDHPAVREGTRAILETDPEVKVDFLNPPFTVAAMEKADFTPYDVILMDMNLGDINGMELSKGIIRKTDDCKIILYTGYDVEDYFDEAIRMGIHGAISKTETKEKILQYIRTSLNNEIILNYDYFRNVLSQQKVKKTDQPVDHEQLSAREKSILHEVEKGLTNQEIADKLHLSKRSIEYSLTAIFNKLNVGSRTEAVLIAKSEGTID